MCVYVHYRIEHLSLNMAMQLLVGVPLEMVHGALRIGLIYVCGALAGGANSSNLHPEHTFLLRHLLVVYVHAFSQHIRISPVYILVNKKSVLV